MGRFDSIAPFYERARPSYGAGLFAEVARRLTLGGSQRLLDLGTGPGVLALGFAPFVAEAVGVDPEPAMLAEARSTARRTGVALRLVEGRAEDLPAALGPFDLVTIGRALHWMDPDPTRAALERLAGPGAWILVCRAASASDGRNPWLAAYQAVRGRRAEPGAPGHRGVDADLFFAPTRFRRSDTVIHAFESEVEIETLADRAMSMSGTSPARLGAATEALREDMRRSLAPFAVAGSLRDVVVSEAAVFASAD